MTGKSTGKRLGRPRRRWEDNIRMDLEEIGFNAGNWVDSTQDRDYWRALVNVSIEPLGSISHGLVNNPNILSAQTLTFPRVSFDIIKKVK